MSFAPSDQSINSNKKQSNLDELRIKNAKFWVKMHNFWGEGKRFPIISFIIPFISAPEAYILFTTDDGLMSTSLNGSVSSAPMKTVRNASRSDALEFDSNMGTYFYTDGYHKNILMFKNTSTEAQELSFPGIKAE